MKLVTAALLLAFLAASDDAHYFRYERAIQVPGGQAGQACLAVEPEIFAHAAPQLADLRLYANGAETPYIIRVATQAAGGERIVPLLNAGIRDGQTVFDVELPDAHYSDLNLTVTAHDFIGTVTVTGSVAKDGKPETKLGSFTIFDLSKQRLGRSTVLHLQESTFPYLHFRVAGPLKPEDVTGISIERLPEMRPRYRIVAQTAQATQKDHSTVFEFTVPAHVPVDRVAFSVGAVPASFSRDVTVSAVPFAMKPVNDRSPLPLAATSSGNLLRVHKMQEGKRLDEERLEVDSPREVFDTQSKWTVTIANGDDAPVSIKSVQLQMLERTLCFDAVAGAAYALRYGDEARNAPQYDYARLFSPQANALQAAAGPEQANAGWQARPDERPFTEKHPILLWAALIAVIAVLGGIALKSPKRSADGT
jgi:hypothetical protein